MILRRTGKTFLVLVVVGWLFTGQSVAAQGDGSRRTRGAPKPVTVPVTIKVSQPETEIRVVDLLVREDGDVQSLLSIRRPAESPITLAVLMQDDLVSSIGSEARRVADFVRQLPAGSRVMIGYIRTGSLEVRRKFTPDLDRAAAAIRPPLGVASASPYNPFTEIVDALKRFDSQPLGRRAVIVVSDGLDLSHGVDSSNPSQSIDLQRAITEAQRRSVAIYSIYVPSAAAAGNQLLVANGQSCLQRLSDDTGGRAFFQGLGPPVSFDPFLKEISANLERQIALTYLSTHPNKGYHRLDVKPVDRDVEVRHPAGYTR
jgi:VWFA-related protein